MKTVSIIIPIIRPASAERCIAAIKKNGGTVPYEIVTDTDDKKVGCPWMVRQLTKMTSYDLVMFLGDDCEPQEGFLEAAVKAMEGLPGGWGVVGLDTQPGNPLAHWMAHKRMLQHIPGGDFFPVEYRHAWCDNELKDIAESMGRWVYAEDSHIAHHHPANETAAWDSGYERAYSDEAQAHDNRTYLTRRRTRQAVKHGVRLAVGLPLTDLKVYSQFMYSFMMLDKPPLYDLLMPHFPGQIDAVRNDMVRQALYLGCTHVLMMDTDQIYGTPDMISRLLNHDLPVVGAKVHRRYPPFDPLLLRGEIGKLHEVPDDEIQAAIGGESNGLVEVDATGCGCILYDTRVFIGMIPDHDGRWFQLETTEAGEPVGEDIAFCKKLKKSEHRIFVDCSIDIQHLTLLAVDWGTWKLYQKLTEARNGKRIKKGN